MNGDRQWLTWFGALPLLIGGAIVVVLKVIPLRIIRWVLRLG